MKENPYIFKSGRHANNDNLNFYGILKTPYLDGETKCCNKILCFLSAFVCVLCSKISVQANRDRNIRTCLKAPLYPWGMES